MNAKQTGCPGGPLAEAARAVAGLNFDADLKLVRKTRCAVRDALISTQEKRVRQRRNLGFAILGFVFMLVLLGPAIWNGVEDLLGEERLFDLPTQIAFLIAMLFLGMLAALIAVWKGQYHVQRDRGGFDLSPD